MSASNSRCSSRLSSVTQLSADTFQLERERERFLVLERALLVSAPQAFVGKAEVEAGAFCLFEAVHAGKHTPVAG